MLTLKLLVLFRNLCSIFLTRFSFQESKNNWNSTLKIVVIDQYNVIVFTEPMDHVITILTM